MRQRQEGWAGFLRRHRRHWKKNDDGSVIVYEASSHSRHRVHIWLRIDDLAILLRPNERTYVMSQLHIDQTVTLSLQAVDVAGNIVAANFTNIQWNNSDETVAKSTVSADGSTVTLDPVGNAVGKATTVNASVSIDGVVFTASVTESVVAGAVASVNIVETFAPKQTAQPAPAPAPTSAPAPAPAPGP